MPFRLLLIPALLMAINARSQMVVAQAPTGHAHNDYAAKRPLTDALNAGMKSIEVDVHLAGGMLYVAHHRSLRWKDSLRLEHMYLEPLFKALDSAGGWFYEDEALLLMIDFKSDGAASYLVLSELLLPYRSRLARWEGGEYVDGPVKVFISGNRPVRLLSQASERLVFLDGRPSDLGKGIPNTLMPVISFRAASGLQTPLRKKNVGEINAELNTWVSRCADEDKYLRLWGAPDKPWFWKLLLDAGIVLVNTDRPTDFRTFVKSYSRR